MCWAAEADDSPSGREVDPLSIGEAELLLKALPWYERSFFSESCASFVQIHPVLEVFDNPKIFDPPLRSALNH
jgi:hypothetical protein